METLYEELELALRLQKLHGYLDDVCSLGFTLTKPCEASVVVVVYGNLEEKFQPGVTDLVVQVSEVMWVGPVKSAERGFFFPSLSVSLSIQIQSIVFLV